MEIPPNIFQTHKSIEFVQNNNSLAKCTKSWDNIKGTEYHFYNDYQSKKFMEMHFPDIFDLYNKLPLAVMRADLWRYCVIYIFGGIYADADTELLDDIGIFLKKNKQLVLVPENETHFCQWVFAAPPKSPILKAVIDLVVERIKDMDLNYEHFIHKTTGPEVFTDGILRYLKKKDKNILNYEGNHNDDIYVHPHDDFHKTKVRHIFAGQHEGGWYHERFDFINDIVNVGSSGSNVKRIQLAKSFDYDVHIELMPTQHADTFEFSLEGSNLIVRRTDRESGWGHHHKCVIKRLVHIGRSVTNIKHIDIGETIDHDTQIVLMPNRHSDEFEFSLDGSNLTVRRTDRDSGWGYPHTCTVHRIK